MCALSNHDQPNATLTLPDKGHWCLSSASDTQQHAGQSVLTSCCGFGLLSLHVVHLAAAVLVPKCSIRVLGPEPENSDLMTAGARQGGHVLRGWRQ